MFLNCLLSILLGLQEKYTIENKFHTTVAFNKGYCKKNYIKYVTSPVSPVEILKQTEQQQNKTPLELDRARHLKARLVGDAYLTSILPMVDRNKWPLKLNSGYEINLLILQVFFLNRKLSLMSISEPTKTEECTQSAISPNLGKREKRKTYEE